MKALISKKKSIVILLFNSTKWDKKADDFRILQEVSRILVGIDVSYFFVKNSWVVYRKFAFIVSFCQLLILLSQKYCLQSKNLWQLCSAMMSWVGYLLEDSEFFILFAENSQILLKITVIPIPFYLSFIW